MKTARVSRRALLAGTGAAVTAGALGLRESLAIPRDGRDAEAQQRFAGNSVRICTWTDGKGQAVIDYIAKPFERETGATVVIDRTGTTSEMVAKLKASRADPQYDVVFMTTTSAVELARAGILEKPDLTKLPNLARVVARSRTEADGFAIGWSAYAGGLIYSQRVFATPPDTWEVLWDKKYAGKIFLPPADWTFATDLIIMAARLAGGSDRNPEPGFKKLEELRGRVLVVGESAPHMAELFRTGALHIGGPYAASLLVDYILRPEYAISGVFSQLKEGFFYDLLVLVIPKGHPGDGDVSHALINYALDARVQKKITEATFLGPVNQAVVLSARASRNPYIMRPASADKGIAMDREYLSTVRPDWVKRYAEIFAS